MLVFAADVRTDHDVTLVLTTANRAPATFHVVVVDLFTAPRTPHVVTLVFGVMRALTFHVVTLVFGAAMKVRTAHEVTLVFGVMRARVFHVVTLVFAALVRTPHEVALVLATAPFTL
jgi:hypothetical protein